LLEKSRKIKKPPNPVPRRRKNPAVETKKKRKTNPDPNWRIQENNFVEKGTRLCEPGAVNFSAGWFAQGHAVRISF
jgi:hypothetical protein